MGHHFPHDLALLALVGLSSLVAAKVNLEDTREPPKVHFGSGRGNSPELMIYPAGGARGDRTWVKLTFTRFAEIDAEGSWVAGHSIAMLMDDYELSQRNEKIDGTTAAVTTLSAPISVPKACSDGTESQVEPGNITIKTFVFADDARIKYGNTFVDVSRGQMKFNIESWKWPFCGRDHKLVVGATIEVNGKRKPKCFSDADCDDEDSSDSDSEDTDSDSDSSETSSGKSGKGGTSWKSWKTGSSGKGGSSWKSWKSSKKSKKSGKSHKEWRSYRQGKRFIAGAGDFDTGIELPTYVVVDGKGSECNVDLDMSAGTNLLFTFPFFNESLVYDPVVAFMDSSLNSQGNIESNEDIDFDGFENLARPGSSPAISDAIWVALHFAAFVALAIDQSR